MKTALANQSHKITSHGTQSKISTMLTEIEENKRNNRLDVSQAYTYPIDDNASPTIVELIKETPPIFEKEICLHALKLFQKNKSVFAIPVVNKKNKPTGIIERNSFVELFVQPYAKELFGKKSVSEFMNKSPLVVDKATAVDDVARIIIDAGMQHMVNGFIATENKRYLGVANGLDLLNEITVRKQNHLFQLAHFDQLTKLPNRTLFLDRLSMAITQAERNQSKVGLIFIDLDNFKHFNDSLGHSVGDSILTEAANRFSSCARESDTVARLSGDEFTIILNDVASDEMIRASCSRILEALNQPLQVMEREMFITASLGFATYPDDDTDIASLLVKADAAMYDAKRCGRNTYRQYMSGMNLYSIDHMALETDLRIALDNQEFELFYQPQIHIETGDVIGSEALIRWHHPSRGLLTPVHFIELVEKTGLIVPIGTWVLKEACRQQVQWRQNNLGDLSISVNISAVQFFQPDFCATVKTIIQDSGIKPEQLILELTESLCMTDVVTALKNLNDLHDLGIKLAIDDFGTGYSNLSYLKKFPIDSLKIDQSFIRHIEKEPINIEIVTAISALGKSMSLELIAEGVETDDEMAQAQACGCEFAQGYRFSKPLPAHKLKDWLNDYQSIASSIQNT